MSENAELYAAIVAAQAEMRNPPLDAKNPHLKNRFASLAAVRNAVVPVFAKHGLAVVQDVTTEDGHAEVTTIVLHKSGAAMTFGPLRIPAQKLDAQGFGSAETYARRYALLAVACIAGEDDDDGEAASDGGRITAEQVSELKALLADVGADAKGFLRYLRVNDLAELQAARFADAVKALEAKRK